MEIDHVNVATNDLYWKLYSAQFFSDVSLRILKEHGWVAQYVLVVDVYLAPQTGINYGCLNRILDWCKDEFGNDNFLHILDRGFCGFVFKEKADLVLFSLKWT